MTTNATSEHHPVLNFIKSSFIGVGQCVLNGNWITGVLIIAAIAYSSWQAALWFLFGAALAQLVAIFFKAPKALINAGMFGFGGGYVGILTGTFMMMHVPHAPGELLLLLAISSILIVPVIMAWVLLFAKLNLSSLALPILTVVWLIVGGFVHSDVVNHMPVAAAAADSAAAAAVVPYTWKTVVYGILSAFGQVFMHGNPVTGGIILLAILVNSRIMGVMAVLGGLLVIGIDMWLGFPEARLASGELLFNSMMTVMALAGFLIYLDWRSVIYALFGGLLAQFTYIAATAVFDIIHLPAMVLGFVVVTLFFSLAAQGLGFVTPVPLEKISKPEESFLKDADLDKK